jgi:hypothetical protein
MKFWFVLGALISAFAATETASAAPLSYADFDLISVVPRSPSVKPLVMAIPAKEPAKQLASKGVRPSEAGR